MRTFVPNAADMNEALSVSYSELSTTAEIARALKVSPRTVQGWRRENKIPSIRLGGRRRFHLPSVWQALQQQAGEEQP